MRHLRTRTARATRRPLLGLAAVGILATLLALPSQSAFAKTIRGTSGDDTIVGTAGPDRIVGRRGDDRLIGRDGADELVGGKGRDRLNSVDGGRDRIAKGGSGHDICAIDRADRRVVKGCERITIWKSGAGGEGSPGSGGSCLSAGMVQEPGEDGGPPRFSDAFYGLTITLNGSVDGLDDNRLPISIEQVCDVPTNLRSQAVQLAGGDGAAIVSASTKVIQGGEQLQGQAAEAALNNADAATLRARLKRPREWARGEGGTPAPRTTEAVIRAADQLAAMNVPYVLGGGHDTPAVAHRGLDCSSTVSWILQHAGFDVVTAGTSSINTRWAGILERWTARQRGMFVVNHADPDGSGGRSGHVFLVIHGRKFENTSLNDEGAHWAGPFEITQERFTSGTHDFRAWHVKGTGVPAQRLPTFAASEIKITD
jgi:Ca2+-binding RTX toxin-like protein